MIIGSRKEVSMESCKFTQVYLSRANVGLLCFVMNLLYAWNYSKSVLSTSAIACLCFYLLTLPVGGPMRGWRCDTSAMGQASSRPSKHEDTITQNDRVDSRQEDRSTSKQIATEVVQRSRCVGRKAEAMWMRFMHDTASLLFSLVRASAQLHIHTSA